MRVTRLILFGTLALLSVTAALVIFTRRTSPVEVAYLLPNPLENTLVISGRVRPPAMARIAAETQGVVRDILVEEGDRVTAGEVLLQLDQAALAAARDEASALLQEARARLLQIDQILLPGAIRAHEEALRRSQQARRERERAEALASAGSLSQSGLEEARLAWESARNHEEETRLRLAALEPEGAEHRLTRAGVARAQAALAAAEVRLAQTRITAPADGLILERQVEAGSTVPAGQVLFVMALDGPVELTALPGEVHLAELMPGQPALASADAYPDLRFEAVVTRIAPSIDPQRGTVEVRLRVPDPPPYLRPQMTIAIEIVTRRIEDAHTLPLTAIRDHQGPSPWVLVITGGRAQRRPVALGAVGNQHAEIRDGLAPGEGVVADALAVDEGNRVRPIGSPPE